MAKFVPRWLQDSHEQCQCICKSCKSFDVFACAYVRQPGRFEGTHKCAGESKYMLNLEKLRPTIHTRFVHDSADASTVNKRKSGSQRSRGTSNNDDWDIMKEFVSMES